MAFHFEPPPDSDEDEAPPDLAAWKAAAVAKATGVKAPAPGAPVLPLMDDNSDDGLASSALAAFHARQMQQSPLAAPIPSFTLINEPVVPVAKAPALEEDDQPEFDANIIAGEDLEVDDTGVDKHSRLVVEDDRDVGTPEDKLKPSSAHALQPVLSLADVNDDDVIDMTAGDNVVRRVLREFTIKRGPAMYEVELEDYSVETLTYDEILALDNGKEALQELAETSLPGCSMPSTCKIRSTRASRRSAQRVGFVNTVEAVPVSEDDMQSKEEFEVVERRGRHHRRIHSQYEDEPKVDSDDNFLMDEEGSEDEGRGQRRTTRRSLRNKTASVGRPLRRTNQQSPEANGAEDDSQSDTIHLRSDLPGTRMAKLKRERRGEAAVIHPADDIQFFKVKRQRVGERQSDRSTRHTGGMKEVDVDDIYRSDTDSCTRAPTKPKAVGVRELFKPLPRNNEFRMRHMQVCETCAQDSNYAPLVYCQGCTLAYHKSCLGHRTGREHLATKIGDQDFVLQCRRCVGYARKKDPTAPDQGKCSECHEYGNACRPFRPCKTPLQEQKERDENGGDDPVYQVHPSRINNADNVLFRCINCMRAFHFEHLPSRIDMIELEADIDIEQRFREYSRDWKCKECFIAPGKIGALIAWKPIDEDAWDPAKAVDEIEEDLKAYLIKWDGKSYFRAVWMPGPWVWGVTTAMMRKAFAKREDAQYPKMRTEDAIPEDYLRTDIVLDIKFTSFVDIRTEEIDKARTREVDKALIKYKGLTYEDAVWEAPPSPEDGERWTDFVTAYNDWVLGRYVKLPTPAKLRKAIEKARSQEFNKLEKHTQPANLIGGELMGYQMEGLNWLYYKWYSRRNAILADEMGLGKTIQIIAFLATLVQEHNVFPFLVVVPNNTCPNWRREIKRWAPSLRVVAYYGSKESRDLAYRCELFPEGSKDLRCHIVVTSYDAATDEKSRRFFRSVPWQSLIVDEGQRLKNDKGQLYLSLGALKVPFRVLLTGTPLQNNQRELFNLLQFLDDKYNAEELEQQYQDLDQEKITELHDLIRPFFLRRTKMQVLTFLPPMAQIIVPVSMTIVQKTVYRKILAKSPELMKAIFSSDGSEINKSERGSLNNILMQLRKCLCHPFVYSRSIEERGVSVAATHRNLVDASSKLKLLEILLPKLRERGHRVLIFSQFLSMLDIIEDFLDGLALPFQRLDGNVSSLQKQTRIDEFNAPDSPYFAFLLSTRAGGVGINLASADTVIILDPDFNPHQDIQALSRAHRIGQTKKVLCFQLVTRASAEERILQVGRKKLALDHVLIQEMDADDADQADLVSVLRHGAGEIFEDSGDQDIIYDSLSVDRLLDRSHVENAPTGTEKSAETQFSFARVWANNSGTLQDEMVEAEERAPDPGVWAKILKERERIAAEEAAAKAEAFGRGRRARGQVDYNDKNGAEGVDAELPELIQTKNLKTGDESDTDFQADDSGDEDEEGEAGLGADDLKTLDASLDTGPKRVTAGPRKKNDPIPFRRVIVPQQKPTTTSPSHGPLLLGPDDQVLFYINKPTDSNQPPNGLTCVACKTYHIPGSCPLKLAGVEHCNLCGIAHFGHARVCPHIQSETQVQAMLEALRHSNEPEHLVNEARRYLRGLKGNLVQLKKQKEARQLAAREAEAGRQAAAFGPGYSAAAAGRSGRKVGWGEGGVPVRGTVGFGR